MSAPIACRWTGEGFEVMPRFRAQADREFVIGAVYTLAELEERSGPSHRFYFAALREAWASLPEDLADQYPSPESLRKRALIQAGFYDEQIIDAGTNAAAIRVSTAVRAIDDFAMVFVRGPHVIRRSAKSQSYRCMPKGEFRESVDKVLAVVADLIGTPPATLSDEGRRAAA